MKSLTSLIFCCAVACVGDIEDSPIHAGLPEVPNDSATNFSCDDSAAPSSVPLRRLTSHQYQNTLRDLLVALSGDDSMLEVDDVRVALASVPGEERQVTVEDRRGGFRRHAQAVGSSLIESWYDVAVAIGQEMGANHLEAIVGACATDGDTSNDPTCLTNFIERAGALAFRRPLEAEEVEFYRGFYPAEGGASSGEDPAGYADVLSGLLSAPQFLYIIEHGDGDRLDGQSLPAERYALSAHELATRLSYHFWDSMPDAELLALAEDGTLLEDQTYTAQVRRLASSVRTRETVTEFYRDWLKLEDLEDLAANNGFARLQAFAGEDLPTPELRDDMIAEVLAMFDYYTWNEDGDLGALLTSNLGFPRSQGLADIYDLPVWDGESAPPSFPVGERPGFLTRAAFLATASGRTRPIMKGVFIREYLLCDHLPDPPADAEAAISEATEFASSRQRVEEITEVEGTACIGCHQSINPLGFATENFDALGRLRDEELLYDEEGNFVDAATIDTSSIPRVHRGDNTPSTGPADLARLLEESGKVEACFARNYFRFTFGRYEDEDVDGCALETIRSAVAEEGSIRAALERIALSPMFRSRSFAEINP